jgi:hypothetical protein
MAPDKPVLNTLDGIESADAPTFAQVHSVLWEAAMAGLSGSLTTGETPDWASGPSFLDSPEGWDAYATACLDLNRLAPVVMGFQRAPAQVAILWSESSLIYGDGQPYLGTVRRAFEGCSFFGHKVRFITERQCGEGALKGVKILVIPEVPALGGEAFEAIEEYVARGGVTIRMGIVGGLDARGISRNTVLTHTANTLLARGRDSAPDFLHAMDAADKLAGLEPVPRVVNPYGYPLEGVKTRFAVVGGHSYLYVVNLRTAPVRAELLGGAQSGRDLIAARQIRFPAVLEPLDPMLIRLDEAAEFPGEAVPPGPALH